MNVAKSTLAFPLRRTAVERSFALLTPESVSVNHNGSEGTVDGSWDLKTLRRALTSCGLHAVPGSDQMLWSNEEKTVGAQLFGVAVHPTENRFTAFTIELQARDAGEVQHAGSVLF